MSTNNIAIELEQLDKEDPQYSQKRMKLMVEYMKRYISTYDKQYGYECYSDQTFTYDILYGLGIALNPKEHRFADGFDTFKNKLIENLTSP
jgi:hypothetical protein